ncbi:MAG TPA: DNA polymerase III subunit gamma/tau [Gemmataceae bacterium]|nr:DNA polymerase III subunit gamma/tau [Gemmataceae bacterium]
MAKKKAAPTNEAQEGYTVLARRYRPQGFSDLVGQEPVAQGLINALQSGRVAHAYLFTGARGVGKTSTARILAKALNCEKGPTATPCNVCENCKAITSGDDVDVLEIDGASNTGVDDVRELRGNVQYRPSRSRYKIYIIDEVHMLSKSAFNALLKTLEEPPPHVKFIFATTEVEKIPITILSRCQRFDFAGIGTPRIVERLRDIVASEKMQADDEALEILARRAGGSMRDAQSLLDQLLAFGGERLTVEHVHRLLGTASDDRVAELAGAALQGDAKLTLELLGKAADDGMQLGELLDQLIGYWRDLMVVNAAGPEAPSLSVGSKHRPALAEQAKRRSLDALMAGLDVLASTRARLRNSNHGRILLEMALVRLGRLEDLVSLSQLAQAVAKGQVTVTPAAPIPLGDASKKKLVMDAERPARSSNGSAVAPTVSTATPSATTDLTEQSLHTIWSQVLAQQGGFSRIDLEKAGFPAISAPNTLVLRFPAGYNAQRDRCQDPEKVGRIEQLLQELTGQKCRLRIESEGGSANAVPSAGIAEEPENSRSRLSSSQGEAVEPPLVKWAKDLLGAKPIKADPDFGAVASASAERAAPAEAEEQ